MKSVLRVLGELAGLFFDDASLAIAVLFILAASAILSNAAWFDATAAAAFLVGGVVAALVENFLRAARIARRRSVDCFARNAATPD
jgi:hypothetical protein